MNKLTTQDVCKYPNAKIEYLGEIYEKYSLLFITNDICLDDSHVHSYPIPVSDCKLELRDIEDITEEELKQVNMELYGNEFEFTDFAKIELRHTTYYRVKDYLRSINVDVDDFIKLGKAVKQK